MIEAAGMTISGVPVELLDESESQSLFALREVVHRSKPLCSEHDFERLREWIL